MGRHCAILFHAMRKNWKPSLMAFSIFIPTLLLVNGILNRYLFVPDWYPSKPTIFTPEDPRFMHYALAWKLSDRWLLQISLPDAIWLFVLSLLFFFNVALVIEIYRSRLKLSRVHWFAYPFTFIAFLGCCFSTVFILLFGVGTLIALAPYVLYFRILAGILFGFNIWLIVKKLSKTNP